MLTVPLAVRLTTAAGDKRVTRGLRDLQFSAVVPGGFASATLSFDQPLAHDDPVVEIYGKVYVYDGRSGATVWEGRQEDPGRGASSDGQVWTLNAFGPRAHAGDNPITVCYAENGIESWQSTNLGIRTARVSTTDDDPPLLMVALNNGTTISSGQEAAAVSRLVADCGQKLARFKVAWDAGVTDANYAADLITGGTRGVRKTAALNTAGGTLAAVITTDFTAGDDTAWFRISRSAAGSVTLADDNHWITGLIVLQGTRYTAAGVEQTTGATYSSDTVLASDVVADLLGRVLTQFDGSTASIATSAFAIDRLVYPDPTLPEQILEDLMALEPAYWAAWESTSNGKARFEWTTWPTTVRYETSITGDFDSPGSVGDLYNKVLVRYRDRNGRTRTVARTRAQTDLDSAGLTRTATIDLGDNIGSSANAAQAGDNFLADHNSPPNAGTLTINAPILDLVAGRMVQPWEVRPGNLIRVRGVLPRVDALNATDRDAVTVFRLVSTDYTASTNTCTAGLDSYSRSPLVNQIYDAHKRIDRLRKR